MEQELSVSRFLIERLQYLALFDNDLEKYKRHIDVISHEMEHIRTRKQILDSAIDSTSRVTSINTGMLEDLLNKLSKI